MAAFDPKMDADLEREHRALAVHAVDDTTRAFHLALAEHHAARLAKTQRIGKKAVNRS